MSGDLGTGHSFGERIAADQVPKKFGQRGWEVGKRPEDDVCPACIDARRKPRLVHSAPTASEPSTSEPTMPKTATAEKPATPVTPSVITIDPPREMTRDDRRLIFAKLDEVYLDEKTGYSSGWSDQTLADDLGVPRSWVIQIRDENFGPAITEDVTKLLKLLGELQGAAGTLRKEVQTLIDKEAFILKRVGEAEKEVKRLQGTSR